jgi:hypothetical protein
VPEFFWLNNDTATSFRWDESHKGNISQALFLKMGYVFFDILFDPGVYRQPVIHMGLERIPSVFGTWGMSLTKAVDTWIPGLEMGLPKIGLSRLSIWKYSIPLEIEPLDVQFHFWTVNRYDFRFMAALHIGYHKK